MSNRPGNRTRLYVLTGVFCLLLTASLVLLYLLRDDDRSGRRSMRTVMVYSNELSVPPEGATKLTVPMEEVPIREVNERVRYSFLTGDSARGDQGSDPDVKYPPLKSAAPLYGQFRDGNAGALWNVRFALDHSEGKSGAYDLLYFDENYDFDLTNDTPRRPLREPTGLPEVHTADTNSIWFEPVSVPFQFESDGRRLIELLPRLWLYRNRRPQISVAAAKIRRGKFEVGGKTYEAFLGYGSIITGRLDQAFSTLCLVCEDGEQPGFVGAEQLNLARSLGGRWYQFSCTPTGDVLFAYPHEGPVGVLRLDAGSRGVKRLEVFGHLRAPGTRIAIGHSLENGVPRGEDHYDIPVGDYSPEYLDIVMGNIRFDISGSPYADTSGRRRSDKAVCSIAIREDKPFVLAFSNKPRVVFVRPQGHDRVAQGEELRIEAVLVDPVLGVMIRGLSDMTQSEMKTYTMSDGQKRTFEWAPSLEPTVVIKRASGEIVGQGVMPFG